MVDVGFNPRPPVPTYVVKLHPPRLPTLTCADHRDRANRPGRPPGQVYSLLVRDDWSPDTRGPQSGRHLSALASPDRAPGPDRRRRASPQEGVCTCAIMS
jgi:hypothetical protein